MAFESYNLTHYSSGRAAIDIGAFWSLNPGNCIDSYIRTIEL